MTYLTRFFTVAICSFTLLACAGETSQANSKTDKAIHHIKKAGYSHIAAMDRMFPPGSFWACKHGKQYILKVDRQTREITRALEKGDCRTK